MGIGARLLEIMKKKNLNTNELAIMIGVPPTTLYSMIKRDSNRVDIDLIIKIAHALDMSPSRYVAKNPLDTEKPVFKGFSFICMCRKFHNYRRFSAFVNQVRSRFGSRFLPI